MIAGPGPSGLVVLHEVDTAFIHHGHEVAIAQFVAEVPANAQDHDLLVKMPTLRSALLQIVSLCCFSWSGAEQGMEVVIGFRNGRAIFARI